MPLLIPTQTVGLYYHSIQGLWMGNGYFKRGKGATQGNTLFYQYYRLIVTHLLPD